MKNIIKIKNKSEFDNILDFGKSCDIDLKHLPFKSFSVDINTDKILNEDNLLPLVKNRIQNLGISDPLILNMMAKNMVSNTLLNNPVPPIEKKYLIENKSLYIINDMYKVIVSNFPNDGIFNTDDLDNLSVEISHNNDVLMDTIINSKGGSKAFEEDTASSIVLAFGIIGLFQAARTPIPYKKVIHHKNKSKQKKNAGSNKYTYINTTVYDLSFTDLLNNEYKNDSDLNTPEKKKYTSHVSVWYQRGHWRKYKNGKRVWIKPCFKRHKDIIENDDNKKDRIYRLNIK